MIREFGDRLCDARSAAGIENMSELARILGVDPDTVAAWERGRNYPKPPDLRKLCDLLGVTADWLLFGGDRVQLSAVVQENVKLRQALMRVLGMLPTAAAMGAGIGASAAGSVEDAAIFGIASVVREALRGMRTPAGQWAKLRE